MKREQISVQPRTVTGKKVRVLRKDGVLPANVYGKQMTSIAVQLPAKDFAELYKKVHETGLVDLTVEGKVYPVLIHNVQRHPITHDPLHADFFKVNLKEKITANIPVVMVGEAQAVTDKKGVLLQLLSELEVEALPTDLPEHIEISVEKLAEVDEQITVAEIKAPANTVITNDPAQAVFRIGELVSKEAEEQEALEAAAAEEAKAEGEAATEEASSENTPTEQTEEKPQAE